MRVAQPDWFNQWLPETCARDLPSFCVPTKTFNEMPHVRCPPRLLYCTCSLHVWVLGGCPLCVCVCVCVCPNISVNHVKMLVPRRGPWDETHEDGEEHCRPAAEPGRNHVQSSGDTDQPQVGTQMYYPSLTGNVKLLRSGFWKRKVREYIVSRICKGDDNPRPRLPLTKLPRLQLLMCFTPKTSKSLKVQKYTF